MSPTIRMSFLAATLMLSVSPTTEAWGSGICNIPAYQDKLTLEPSEEYFGGYILTYWNSDKQCSENLEQGVSYGDFRITVSINVGTAHEDNMETLVVTSYPKEYLMEPNQEYHSVVDGGEIKILFAPGLF